MFASLRKLAALPAGTKVCCGHEYTESNARFALSVDADNTALQARTEEARRQRAAGQPTVPSTMASELRPTRSCARPTSRPSPTCARRRTGSDVKLCFSPTSPYVRKVRACAITRGIDARIELVPTDPDASRPEFVAINPWPRCRRW